MFTFRKFRIHDDRSAMKVGTDGVLLGAWTQAGDALDAMDIGAGCGLVALMLAQRYPGLRIKAVEIDTDAAVQAGENVAASAFSGQVSVVNADILDYAPTLSPESLDLIVSNPPFFQETLLPPDTQRASARHTLAGLDFEALVSVSARLLKKGGGLAVIIPKTSERTFHALCALHGLSLLHATDVRTVERKPVKRVLLHFHKGPSPQVVVRDGLVLMQDGHRSEAYSELCREFYLH